MILTPGFAKFLIYFVGFVVDLLDAIYLALKIFRVFCFTKVTFEQLPLFNPYRWPLSFIRIVTRPYLGLFSKRIPNLKIGMMSYDISTVISLQLLSSIIKFYKFIAFYILVQADIFTDFLREYI